MYRLFNDEVLVAESVEKIWFSEDMDAWVTTTSAFADPQKAMTLTTPPSTVSPIEFKMLFTSAERIAIKASTDPVVQDFFSLIEDPRLTQIRMSLKSIGDALSYLEGVGVLSVGRKAEILTGEPT